MVSKYKNFSQKLQKIMDISQAEAELRLILESVELSKQDFWLNKDIPDEKTAKINLLIEKRLMTRAPIQHLLGYGYFMGEKFIVNSDVLIPRPETELLVKEASKLKADNILDIGTGSGCIAIMLKKLTNKNIMACDISKKALEIARQNAKNLDAKIDFIESDLFSNIKKTFDIIVSNPPYIPPCQKHALDIEVKNHEPHLALFAPDESGVEFYKKIIEKACEHLNQDGFLIFEIGIGQAKTICELLKNNNFSRVKVLQDLAKIDRIIIAQRHF
ncbi:MAG: peptide chain release factor N(5)-glutamine methyltransferase [Candidatus Gastranaerophilales bacterium]|nr:peptide chain release factor N(5)-glutamine methyltransferase [Candidatus Gastranaerophilales bacterium]